MRLQTTHVLLLTCYTACNVICAYIACMLLTSISNNFSSNSHVNIRLKVSCTVCMHCVLPHSSSDNKLLYKSKGQKDHINLFESAPKSVLYNLY